MFSNNLRRTSKALAYRGKRSYNVQQADCLWCHSNQTDHTKTSVCIGLNHISGSRFTTSTHNFLGKNCHSIRAQSAARCRAGRAVGAPGGIGIFCQRNEHAGLSAGKRTRTWPSMRDDASHSAASLGNRANRAGRRMQGWSHAEGREGRSNVLLSLALSEDELWDKHTHTLHRLYRLALPFSCLNVPLLIHMKTISKLQTGWSHPVCNHWITFSRYLPEPESFNDQFKVRHKTIVWNINENSLSRMIFIKVLSHSICSHELLLEWRN